MQGSEFDEGAFFAAIASSGARALLIGRRALVALGLPVLTADYDFWLHGDDIQVFNDVLTPLGLAPTRSPQDARATGRYVLENDEHVDVIVALQMSTVDGVLLRFDEVWSRRQEVTFDGSVRMALPCLDDLMATKRLAMRDRDLADLRLLQALKERES